MKKAILFSLVFLFVIFNWSLNPTMKPAEAITLVSLISPSDSTKVATGDTIFEWRVTEAPKEKVKRFHIRVAEDPASNSIIWQDTNVTPSTPFTKTRYLGPSLNAWQDYFWSVRVQVESILVDTTIAGTDTTIDTTFVTAWYKFVKPFTFFYATASLIGIPDSLPTIQKGIMWSTEGDTVLVKPGTYYENLRFNRKGVVLASHFARNDSIATIYKTIIDGDSLTWKKDNGSVIYFTSDADSNSKLIGFTIRNGKGTKFKVGSEEKVRGGGIFCEPASTPTIAYNVITQNQATDDGGGIFIDNAAPNILNNIITQNSAGGSGGAIECFYSIRARLSAGSSLPEGEGKENEGIETMSKPSSSSPEEIEETSLPSESNSKTGEDDLDNSLYPRDATEVFTPPSSDPLFEPAVNHPPVPVVEYYDKKTGVKKPKYEVGDTIVLDASKSYDPDSLDGDSIIDYSWEGRRYGDCKNPNISRTEYPNPQYGKITKYVVTTKNGGFCQFRLLVTDTYNSESPWSVWTDSLNVQYRPTADAGKDTLVLPGNTVWLDGSASCDINPDDDTTLSFLWTRVSGPGSVAIVHPESAKTYFVSDESQGGIHIFQLKVSDSDTFILATKKVTVDRYPVPVTFDSLAGFPATIESTIVRTDTLGHTTVKDTIVPAPLPLDASLSFDPDSSAVSPDTVKYFIWKAEGEDTLFRSFFTCSDTLKKFNIDFVDSIVDSSKTVQYFRASEGGGIYKVLLYVRDKYGVRSKNTDTLVVSVQIRPMANAGPDTIVRRSLQLFTSYINLHGSACEVNWDQKSSLKYEWFKNPKNPSFPPFDPADGKSQNVKIQAPKDSSVCGVYYFALRVQDPYETSALDDTVKVIVNALPQAKITKPTKDDRFTEGATVELDASESYDPDAAVFGGKLTFKWECYGAPPGVACPPIINSTKPKASVVPLKRGDYKFRVVVHDTISPKQYPDTVSGLNVATIKVAVDTTFIYPSIVGNLISSNTAGLKGGGIDCQNSSPDIINNIFYKNKSSSSGGAVCCRSSSTPLIKRSIFFGNISLDSTGGAIADLKAELSPSAFIGFREKLVITTNDFWNNFGRELYQPPADTSNNIFKFPRLIDPEYGNFKLECSSPCRKDSIGLLRWLYPDTCDSVPPLSRISLSLFQNPVATAVAHFLVNTNVALKTPPVAYVTIGGGSPAPVYFTSISSTTYRGNFVFTASGTVHISVFATSIQEVTDTLKKDFSVQLIGAGKMGKLVSHDNRLEVLFPQDASKGEIYATSLPVSDDPQYNFEDKDKVALGEAYHLGPPSDFKKELTISFPLDGYDLTDKDKSLFSIYGYEKNGWEREASFLDENSICAKVTKLGVYRLVYDANQEHITGIPKTYQLSQNYPNPFNPETMIRYDLPDPGYVNITVYNILGQKVKTLVEEYQEAGHKSVNWDGKDGEGREVASGIYFYKIKATGFEKTKKMVLLK
jgi:hypothetical protein